MKQYLYHDSETGQATYPQVRGMLDRIQEAYPDETHVVRRQLATAITQPGVLFLPGLRQVSDGVMLDDAVFSGEIRSLIADISDRISQESGEGRDENGDGKGSNYSAEMRTWVRSLAKSQRSFSAEVQDEVYRIASDERMNCGDLIQILFAVSNKKMPLNEVQKQRLSRPILENVSRLCGREVSTALISFARLGIHNGIELLMGRAEEIQGTLNSCDVQFICRALMRVHASTVPDWLLQRMDAISAEASAADVAVMFELLGKFRIHEMPSGLLERLEEVLPKMDPRDVTEVAKGLADMRGKKCPVALYDRISEVAPEMSSRDVATTLSAFINLEKYTCPDSLLQRVHTSAPQMSALDVCHAARTLPKFGIVECPAPLLERAKQLAPAMSVRDIVIVFRNFSKMVNPDGCPEEFLARVREIAPKMSALDILLTIRGCAAYGVRHLPVEICDRLANREILLELQGNAGNRRDVLDNLAGFANFGDLKERAFRLGDARLSAFFVR